MTLFFIHTTEVFQLNGIMTEMLMLNTVTFQSDRHAHPINWEAVRVRFSEVTCTHKRTLVGGQVTIIWNTKNVDRIIQYRLTNSLQEQLDPRP